MDAYTRLHELGVAHSVEAWQGDTLVGGLYGVSIGGLYFVNTMGAATGALAVGFVLLHFVELNTAIYAAAAINLFVIGSL